MAQVFRPQKFNDLRRTRRNAKARDARKRRQEKRTRLMRFFNRIFWVGIEPELMWESTPQDRDGANDNANRR